MLEGGGVLVLLGGVLVLVEEVLVEEGFGLEVVVVVGTGSDSGSSPP